MASSTATSQQPNKSTKNDVFWFLVSGAFIAMGLSFQSPEMPFATLHGSPPCSMKAPFIKWMDFYPFYLTQHRDPITRILHATGTSIIFYLVARYPKYRSFVPNLLIGMSIGSLLTQYFSPLNHGHFEALGFMLTVNTLSWIRGMTAPWQLGVIGYAFAWVGHFVFEQNKPATFLYPTYSMISDFVMFFQIITGQIPLTERLP